MLYWCQNRLSYTTLYSDSSYLRAVWAVGEPRTNASIGAADSISCEWRVTWRRPADAARYVSETESNRELSCDNNPYDPPVETTAEIPCRTWHWACRFAILGAIIGTAIPIVNVVRVFAWMWSRPPARPGTGYSGTPGVVALFVAMIGCPLLALAFGTIGASVGGILDLFRASFTSTQRKQIDT